MKKTVAKIFLIVLVLTGIVFVSAVIPTDVLAQNPRDAACAGVGAVTGTGSCAEPADSPTINSTIQTVINLLSLVVGITAVIMVIIGGFKYITSAGNDQSVNSAKNTILFAIVGLVVVALAQVIVRFVIGETTAPPPPPAAESALIEIVQAVVLG